MIIRVHQQDLQSRKHSHVLNRLVNHQLLRLLQVGLTTLRSTTKYPTMFQTVEVHDLDSQVPLPWVGSRLVFKRHLRFCALIMGRVSDAGRPVTPHQAVKSSMLTVTICWLGEVDR